MNKAKECEVAHAPIHAACNSIAAVTLVAREIESIIRGNRPDVSSSGVLIKAGQTHAMPFEARLSASERGAVQVALYDSLRNALAAVQELASFSAEHRRDEIDKLVLANWLYSASQSYLKSLSPKL